MYSGTLLTISSFGYGTKIFSYRYYIKLLLSPFITVRIDIVDHLNTLLEKKIVSQRTLRDLGLLQNIQKSLSNGTELKEEEINVLKEMGYLTDSIYLSESKLLRLLRILLAENTSNRDTFLRHNGHEILFNFIQIPELR